MRALEHKNCRIPPLSRDLDSISASMIMMIIYKNIMIFLTSLNNYLRNKKYDRSLGGEAGRELILYFVKVKCKYRENHILLYIYIQVF